ncbi:MAG TPA: hypothetical protein PLJ21_05550, partial [Pseudobdellovibrionaceae bacterium]|nr:hypothetical protein [Pseudobdellovibrionaceae bacterium]
DVLEQKKKILALSLKEDQRRTVELVFAPSSLKSTLFQSINFSGVLLNPQRWMSWNARSKAVALLEWGNRQKPKIKSYLENQLKKKTGLKMSQLLNDEFQTSIHTDGVVDIFKGFFVERQQVSMDQNFQELGAMIPVEDVELRFFSRTPNDLNLGKRCGDCTAVGNINFKNSLTWFYNPMYQIVSFQKSGKFLGKIHIALVDINEEPALLIDALEFNPQVRANEEYKALANQAFPIVIQKIKDLANKENRKLYALVASNSTGANKKLKDFGSHIENDNLRLRIHLPARAIINMLKKKDFTDEMTLYPYYQTIDRAARAENSRILIKENSFSDSSDDRFNLYILAELENRVFIPSQQRIPGFTQLLEKARETQLRSMREGLFKQAANLILNNPDLKREIYKIYRLSDSTEVSSDLLVSRLSDLYPVEQPMDFQRTIILNSNSLVLIGN